MGNWAQDIAINTLWYNNTAGEDPTEAAGGTTPDSASVSNGSVAINTADGLMWVKVTNGGLSGWEEVGGGGSGVITSLNNATVDELVTVGDTTTELDAETNLTFDGTKLQIGGRTHHSVSISSGSVPISEYGIFRYALDGGGGSADTLAFSSAQVNATPASANAGSAFWTMLNESNGGTGNRLIFEPSVSYDFNGDSTKNNAWIGWHNILIGVNSYYFQAGNGTASYPSITFLGNQDNGFFYNPSQGTGTISISIAGTEEYVFSGSYFSPEDDGNPTLGGPANRWMTVYASNGTINTSDLRLKTQIQPTTLGLDFINSLNPVSYKWKDKLHQPTHQGLIAQEVLESLGEAGIHLRDEFGALDGDEDTNYGLNYGEFVPILIKAMQELTEKIKRLEKDK